MPIVWSMHKKIHKNSLYFQDRKKIAALTMQSSKVQKYDKTKMKNTHAKFPS
jgi:hypothetical protein